MGIILGAEKKIVFLNTHKPSPVDQATVNIIGVFRFMYFYIRI